MYDPNAYQGDDVRVDQLYGERARGLIKQPTLVEGLSMAGQSTAAGQPMLSNLQSGPPPNRGEEYSDLVSVMIFPAFRLGLLIQTIALAFSLAVYHGQGGTNAFTFDLYNFGEKLRTSPTFVLMITTGITLYTAGLLCNLIFQAFLTDNGKYATSVCALACLSQLLLALLFSVITCACRYSRGFRTGSKLMMMALNMDLLVQALRILAFVYAYHFLSERWWLHHSQTKTDFAIFYVSALLHGVSLLSYGFAIFYMETYHDEGTFEEFGWVCLGIFGFAGLSEIAMVMTGWGAYFGLVQLLGLLVATIWAMSFEPLLHFHSGPLHERTIQDEDLMVNLDLSQGNHMVAI